MRDLVAKDIGGPSTLASAITAPSIAAARPLAGPSGRAAPPAGDVAEPVSRGAHVATAAMLTGWSAGRGCNIPWMSGRIVGSMSERSGTTRRFAIASTSEPRISIGRPRSAAARTRPKL